MKVEVGWSLACLLSYGPLMTVFRNPWRFILTSRPTPRDDTTNPICASCLVRYTLASTK
jgi:hypothetical protein